MEISHGLGLSPDKLRTVFISRIGESRYKLWFANRVRFAFKGDNLVVHVPNRHLLDWLNSRFRKDLETCAKELFHQPCKVIFELLAGGEGSSPDETSNLNPNLVENSKANANQEFQSPKMIAIDSACRKPAWEGFETFFPGNKNLLPFETARRFAQGQSEHCNPLVLYGPSGSGKTHLLGAIFKKTKANPVQNPVYYLTAEDFTAQFVSAVQKGRVGSFRAKYYSARILLVDDCQFLAEKPATQKEFLHLIDGLQRSGGVLAVSLDNHPQLKRKLLPEISDRLAAGVVCPLMEYDEECRGQFIKAFWKKLSPYQLDNIIVQFLMRDLPGNMRELQGILRQIANQSGITQQAPVIQWVQAGCAKFISNTIRKWSLSEIENAVCQLANLTCGSLRKPINDRNCSILRSIAIYLARKWTVCTYREIGAYFGRKNHSTVIAAVKRIQKLIKENEAIPIGKGFLPIAAIQGQIESQLRGFN